MCIYFLFLVSIVIEPKCFFVLIIPIFWDSVIAVGLNHNQRDHDGAPNSQSLPILLYEFFFHRTNSHIVIFLLGLIIPDSNCHHESKSLPVSELCLFLLDQTRSNCTLPGKETSSLMSNSVVKEHKLYLNHPQL